MSRVRSLITYHDDGWIMVGCRLQVSRSQIGKSLGDYSKLRKEIEK